MNRTASNLAGTIERAVAIAFALGVIDMTLEVRERSERWILPWPYVRDTALAAGFYFVVWLGVVLVFGAALRLRILRRHAYPPGFALVLASVSTASMPLLAALPYIGDQALWQYWWEAPLLAALFGIWVVRKQRSLPNPSNLTRLFLIAGVTALLLATASWIRIYRWETTPSGVGWGLLAAILLIPVAMHFITKKIKVSVHLLTPILALVLIGTLFKGLREEPEIPGPPEAALKPEVPTVILLTIDTLRGDALDLFGSESVTPNLREFASDATVFTNAHSVSGWTLPSLASISTGYPPAIHQAIHAWSRVPDELPTLAQAMQEAGYLTGLIGENAFWHPRTGLRRGFDDYQWHPRPQGCLGVRMLERFLPPRLQTYASTPQLTDLAQQWIADHQDAPYFLWLHYFDPHMPYIPPREFLPEEIHPKIGKNFWSLKEVRDGELILDQEGIDAVHALYMGEVRYVDANVGQVMKALKQAGRYDEALIVVASDHGEEIWDHDGFEHGHTLYEELLHVPLMVKLPRSASHVPRVDALVSTASIFATVRDLCGIATPPAPFLAPSLASAIRGEAPPPPFHFFESSIYDYYRWGLIDGDWKYIHGDREAPNELYNLARDPEEKDDRYEADTQHRDQIEARFTKVMEDSKAERERLGIRPDDPNRIVLPAADVESLKALGYL